MKYIGPFLRMNVLSKENIEAQLKFYARESFKHIVLHSRCGVITGMHPFKLKNIPNLDINTFKRNSPLLCLYRKSSAKLNNESSVPYWDDSTFKKEIDVTSNAFMTLSLLNLSQYYNRFKDVDPKLYALKRIYSVLAKRQLDFYSSNLRNLEGVFVNKEDIGDNLGDKDKFSNKTKKFKYSDQALLMTAFYKTSELDNIEEGEAYKLFALDIFNMFVRYKDDLYNLSVEELNSLCFAMNLFANTSKHKEADLLLMDLYDLLDDTCSQRIDSSSLSDIEKLSLYYINMNNAYSKYKLSKFKDSMHRAFEKLQSYYADDLGIILTDSSKKENDFSAQDITLYLLANLLHLKDNDDNHSSLIEVYKRQFINSGLVLSWPDTPNLDSAERYKNFSFRSEDVLDDSYFKLSTIPTLANSSYAPILLKEITYNKKKDNFSQSRASFDSRENMPCIFYILEFLNDNTDIRDEDSDEDLIDSHFDQTIDFTDDSDYFSTQNEYDSSELFVDGVVNSCNNLDELSEFEIIIEE